MDWKAIGGKFIKGAVSGATASLGTLEMTGHLQGNAWKGVLFAVVSAGIHAGWEAIKQYFPTV
jgi:hypothetical protein